MLPQPGVTVLYYYSIQCMEPLYKDTPEIMKPPLIRTPTWQAWLQQPRKVHKTTPEMRTPSIRAL